MLATTHPNKSKEPLAEVQPDAFGGELYTWLSLLLESGASMARGSLLVLRGVLGLSAVSWLFGIYFLLAVKDYHWIWGSGYGLLACLPVLVLLHYHWILSGLAEAPKLLFSLKGAIFRFMEQHPNAARSVIEQKFSSLGKWRTYRLIGRVLKDILNSASDISAVSASVKTLTLMANPVFWLTLVISMVATLAFSGFVAIAFCLLALWG